MLIFAYGSLMGDNALRDCRGRRALLRGYHRSFNHLSARRWGTGDHPCPIFGLSPGGQCWGVAFEVPAESRRAVWPRLERRESVDERAHGIVGTGPEYVRTVVHALELHGLRDAEVQALWERMTALT